LAQQGAGAAGQSAAPREGATRRDGSAARLARQLGSLASCWFFDHGRRPHHDARRSQQQSRPRCARSTRSTSVGGAKDEVTAVKKVWDRRRPYRGPGSETGQNSSRLGSVAALDGREVERPSDTWRPQAPVFDLSRAAAPGHSNRRLTQTKLSLLFLSLARSSPCEGTSPKFPIDTRGS
jgi:hypothetical protein